MNKSIFISLIIIIFIISSCVRTTSKKVKNEDAINELQNLFKNNESNNVNKIIHPKDTIDFNAFEISKDSLDIELFNILSEYNSYSEDKLLQNIEILINKGADPNALVEYSYSVRKAGTYIPIIKHFYKNKYRTYSDYSTPFLEAVNSNSYNIVSKMISLKADVNRPNKSEIFPIDVALKNDNKKIIDLLIQNGCNVVFANLSASENIDMIEKFVSLGADSETIDINFALENEQTLKRILKLNPDINNSELDYRLIFRDENILDILLEAGLNNTSRGKFPDDDPLILGAIKYGDINTVKKLQNAGIDIFYKNRGKTSDCPFLEVIKSKRIDLIKYYIEQGANVNDKDWTRKSALVIAVDTDNDEIIKLLIDAGANKEYSGYFYKTPLMHAIDYDEYISAQTLINEGVNVNYKNRYNESCLSVAIKEANLPMIKLLIENGADVNTMYKKMNMVEYAKSVDAPNMIINYLENLE